MANKFQMEQQIARLEARLDKQERTQTAALRRVHLLPDNVRRLVNAETLGNGVLTPDGQGMTYSIGGVLDLTIRPYAEEFELVDATGTNAPLTIVFGTEDDFDLEKVLAIVGYAELTKRSGDGQTGSDWVRTLNGVPAFA